MAEPTTPLPSTTVPWGTRAIVALNVAVFLVQVALGGSLTAPTVEHLVVMGGNVGPLYFEHEWWRLFTYAFLHAGAFHLVMNMSALWQLGGVVEKLLGTGRFLVVYLLAAPIAGLAKLAWNPIPVSVGASGCIFALEGVLLAIYLVHRQRMPDDVRAIFHGSFKNLVIWVVILAVAIPNIDHAAHLGGFVGGLLIAWGLVRPAPDRRFSSGEKRWVLACLLGTVVFAGVAWQLAIRHDVMRGISHVVRGEKLFAEERYDDALVEFRAASEAIPAHAPFLMNIAVTLDALGRSDEALEAWSNVLAREPDNPLVLNNQAWLLFRKGAYEQAIAGASRSIELRPDAGYAYGTRGWARFSSGDRDGARADLKRALELATDPVSLHYERGMLAFIDGKPADARAEWEAACALKKTACAELAPWIAKTAAQEH